MFKLYATSILHVIGFKTAATCQELGLNTLKILYTSQADGSCYRKQRNSAVRIYSFFYLEMVDPFVYECTG